MRSKNVMTTNVATVGPGTDVRTIARSLIERRISAVPVLDHAGRIIGIVGEGDLMRRAEAGTERHPSWWLELLVGPEEKARDYAKSHAPGVKTVQNNVAVGAYPALHGGWA